MPLRRSFPVPVTLFLLVLACQNAIARDLTLEDRIHAQEAIERVHWGHRIWPPENRAPKPALEEVLSGSQIRAGVIDYIRKSNALAALWNRPITAEQLQDEMQRMAAESQAPDVLRELFAALGGDPFTIAETLARQALADRLIREAYAGDDRFGVGIRRRTPAALVGGLDQAADSASRRRSFDAWWADAGASVGEDLVPVSESIQAVEIHSAPACVEDSWRAIPAGPAPFIGHTAVWTGTEMIIWGQYSTGYPATGGRYNPATNSWTATSDVNAPVTRYAHRAVWTGTEMIVWGGHLNGVAYPSGYLNDGGRYDPTTNSWRPTSAAGAPGPRESHSAIWTGSEMIIWGGDTGQGTTNSGGRYDPASDTWVGTSEVNVPGTRALHTAVWTGTEMIVWGGDGDMAVNTGGRYNPSTGSWTPTSLANAPGRRSRHTAIWTGSRMIVWGGGPFYTNTGGMYDPFQDTWTPTSMSGAIPDGREGHSAVWTGREMIIWGGHQGGAPFNGHGGRYDPALGTWVPMSSLGAPLARPGSTAVWTGSEMLVWAGFAGTSNGYSGRYCASAGEDPPANDDIAGATTIGVLPFIETLDTRSATASPGDPFCIEQGATVWYRYTLSPGPRFQRIDISTAGSSYPTTVSVYTGTPGSLVQIACGTTEATFTPTSGETFYLMVGSASGVEGGTLMLSVTGLLPLELFVSVDPEGFVTPRTNSATIRGSVFCTRPVTVRLAGQLLQDTEPTGVYAPFFLDLGCTGSMAWSASVSPFEIGKIRPGPAEVSVRATASDPETGETAEAQASATVTLRARRRVVSP